MNKQAERGLSHGVLETTSTVKLTVTDTIRDLEQILTLQAANRPDKLTPEDIQSQGIVTLKHDLETLQHMHRIHPHIVAKTKTQQPEVIAYALCMTRAAEKLIDDLSGIFSIIDSLESPGENSRRKMSETRYFVMGQVCVAKDFRGTGVFQGLYQQLMKEMSTVDDSDSQKDAQMTR